ncbi:glucosyl/glucuronosyl transferase [Anopheles darlingi]|uniref:Glucosyl/glucuronosyl transferase n=1 Tax=Anopheles darlingi TaxID=43151 RepID=W5JC85_ANODA|nr:glucosyl/glucuronosyl transferase [Anopheles darlingi]
MRHLILLSLAFLAIVAFSDGYKILFLAPFPGPSHWLMMKHFISELAGRGHEVTCITAFQYGEPAPPNYTEVYIDPPYPIRKTFPVEALFAASQSSDFEKLYMYWDLGVNTSRHGLESDPVRQFIARRDLTFDLIIAEQFFQESWLMFAHQYDAPIVTISTYGYSDFFDRIMGLRTPLSFVPHMIFSYEDDMSTSERLHNLYISMYDAYYRQNYYLPKQNRIAQKAFADWASETGRKLPDIVNLEKSISVILVNSHPVLNRPRPTIRGLVDIGGAHIRPVQPLDPQLRVFIEGADEHGVIYFSLGAYMQSAVMPADKRQAILNVFGSLPQRVIWKFEDESLQKKAPPNVLIRKWAPQNDILAQPQVRLFISHGGQFGTFEAMKHGVPTLFFPFFADQQRNADRAILAGFAERMNFADITEQTFAYKIRRMLENDQYREKARHIATLFNDTLVDPMESAIYWIEYVARYRGAQHLKSHAVKLTWLQYHMYDMVIYPLLLSYIIYILYGQKLRRMRKYLPIVSAICVTLFFLYNMYDMIMYFVLLLCPLYNDYWPKFKRSRTYLHVVCVICALFYLQGYEPIEPIRKYLLLSKLS